MNNLDGIVLQDARQSPDRSAATPRTLGSAIVAYCIALPLFGRAVFPLARDKAHITLASSFTDPQIVTTYLVALIVMSRLFAAGSLFGQEGRGRVAQRLLLFVAVCLVSSFASRFPLFSVWRSFEVLLLGLWAAVMIRDSSGASDPAAAIRAFYAISVAILVGVFIGLVINPNGAWSMEGDVARLTGTTGYSINPNDIGAIAAVLSVGCYVRAVERGSLRYLVAMLLSFAVCYVSHSRGSYVAFAAGFVAATCMLARLERRRAIVAATSGVAVMLLAAACLVSQSVRGFFVFLMTRGHESGNLDSLGGRWQLWEFGLKVFRQHPMLGTGYGTYPEGLEGGHFHNVFIELIVTTG
ncbi:MAG: O-Antigen ligase, partial [Pseudomonadota bacterium]